MKTDNITWHQQDITLGQREERYGHKAACLWFTGLSGSGKSTLANAVQKALFENGVHTYILDGDNIRHGLNKDLGFSAGEREENIRRIGEVANLFVDAGMIVLSAFISPYRKDRDRIRNLLPEGKFIEVFVDCPLEICEQRDPKGLYNKARKGEIKDFTGIDAPYEKPLHPEIVIDNSGKYPIEENVKMVLRFLTRMGIISE